MTWLIPSIFLAVVLVALIAFRLSMSSKKRMAEKSSDRRLEDALADWESFLLYKYSQVRRCQLFSNRARVVWEAGGNAKFSDVNVFLGLVALLELGLLDMEDRELDEELFQNRVQSWTETLMGYLPQDDVDSRSSEVLQEFFENVQFEDLRSLFLIPINVKFPGRAATQKAD